MTDKEREKKHQQRMEDLRAGRVDFEAEKAARQAEEASRKERDKEQLQAVRNLQRAIGRGTGGIDLTGAISRLGIAVASPIVSAYGIGKSIIGAAQHNLSTYAGYSGQGIRAQVLSDVADFRRNIMISNATSASMENFTQAMTRMKDAFAPWMIMFHNFINELGAGIADKAAGNVGVIEDIWKELKGWNQENLNVMRLGEELEAEKAKPEWQAERDRRRREAVKDMGDEQEKDAARLRALGFDEEKILKMRLANMAKVLQQSQLAQEHAVLKFENETRQVILDKILTDGKKSRDEAKKEDARKAAEAAKAAGSFKDPDRRLAMSLAGFGRPASIYEAMMAGGMDNRSRMGFGGFIAPHALVGPSGTGVAVAHPDMGMWGPAGPGRGGPGRMGAADMGPIMAARVAREKAMDEARAARRAEEVRIRERRRAAIERDQVQREKKGIDDRRIAEGRPRTEAENRRWHELDARDIALRDALRKLVPRTSRRWAMRPAAGIPPGP